MVTKLKSISKNPIFGLAFKGLVFCASLYFYYLSPSIWRGVLLAVVAFWFYNRPSFNFPVFLPIMTVLLLLALWIGVHQNFLSFVSLAALAFSFAVIIGIKNLTITHRAGWHYLTAFILSYLLLLNFFAIDKSSLFSWKWLASLALLIFIFEGLVKSRVALLVIALLVGEIMWLVNWLPIGVLSSTNLTMVALLFLMDAAYCQRFSWKNFGLMTVLFIVILSASYWSL